MNTKWCNGVMSTSLIDYIKGLPDDKAREKFASRVGSSVGHLRNVGYGYKPCSHKLAALVWTESDGIVSRESLCPDDYWLIWPDLKAPKTSKVRPGQRPAEEQAEV